MPCNDSSRLRKERDAARGTIDSIMEAIKGDRFKDGIGSTAEWYVRYTLGTAGHLYHVEGYMAVAAERDEWMERCRKLCDPPHNGYWAEILAEAREALSAALPGEERTDA